MDASIPLRTTPADPSHQRCSRSARRAAHCLLALGALAVHVSADAQLAEPFRTRNLNPFVAILPWPAWQVPDIRSGTRLIALAEAANHYTFSAAGAERIALDGETWRTSLFVQHSLSERWSVGVEIPYMRQSGGVLDDLVDGFHSVFRLPDGGRNFRPEGALSYELSGAAGQVFRLESSASGLGDLQLSLARRIGDGAGALLVQGTVTLPTGAPEQLFGSDAAGAALSVLQSRPLSWRGRPAGLYWAASVLLPGDPELPGLSARRPVWLGTLGGSWRVWPRVGFKVQLDAHGAFYRSGLTELGSTGIQATLGGWWQVRDRQAIEVAFNEDLRVSSSPDVVIQVALRWEWE